MPIRFGFLILFLSSLSASCATRKFKDIVRVPDFVARYFNRTEDVKVPEKEYHDELAAFVPEYVESAKKHGVIIPDSTVNMLRKVIYVDELSVKADPNVMAACARFYVKTKSDMTRLKYMVIEVLRERSDNFTEGNRAYLRLLMFHELTHCLMNLRHLPTGVEGIMAPTLKKRDPEVISNWDNMVEELFSPTNVKMIPSAS